MDNISKIDLAVGLDLEQLKRDKDKAEALVRHLTEVNRKIETTFEIKLLNEKEIKYYAKNLMSSIQSDFDKALKEQEKESRDSINRRYKTEEQLFIKHSNYLSQLQDKINKETDQNAKKALQERYNLANNANFGSEAELSKFKGKTEKIIAWTKKEAQEEIAINKAKNDTIRQLEERLAGETRAIYRKSYQDRIQYISSATIKNKEQLDKTLSDIRVMAKQADNEFNKMSKSYKGALSSETGTTFGHKFLTTSQYAISGLALLKVREAMSAVVRESMAYDDAIYNNMTVLQANRKEAEMLADTSRALSITYGGNIKDIDELTLTLGRAGVEVKNLKEATQASVELATITGDSFKDASEVTSSFITTFIKNMDETGLSVGRLADKLGYVANASKLSVKDLGTVGNYALLTSQKLNLTTDATGALITSFSNLGMQASTIGTSFRRIDLIFSGAGFDKVFKKLGETQDEWRTKIRENSDELINFGKALKNLSVEEYEAVTKGMDILAKNTLDAMRNGADIAEGHLLRLKNAADLSVMAQAKAMGATTQMQRITNAVTTSLDGLVTKVLDFSERSDISKLTEEYSDLSKQLEKTGITQAEITKINERLNAVQGELEGKVGSFNDKLKTLNSTVTNTIEFIVSAGAAYLVLKTVSAGAGVVMTKYKDIMLQVSTATAANTVTTRGLSGAVTTLATSSSFASTALITLRTALVSTGFGAISVGVGLVAAAIFDISSSSKKASLDVDNLAGSLDKLTKSQLEYRNNLLQDSITDAYGEYDKAYRKALKSNSLEDKNARDEAKNNYKMLLEERDRYYEEIGKRNKQKETTGVAKKDVQELIDANRVLQESEEKIAQLRRKANEDRLKYNGSDYAIRNAEIEIELAKEIVKAEEQKFSLLQKSKNITDEQYDKAQDSLIDAKLKLQDLTRKGEKTNTTEYKKSEKELVELNRAYRDIASIGMSEYEKSIVSITEKAEQWIKAGVSQNEALKAKSLLLDELNAKQSIENTKEDLSYYERRVQLQQDSYEKEIELANIAYTQKSLDIQSLARPIEDKERLLALETEIYNKTLERLKIEDNIKQIEEESEDKLSLLEYQNSLIEATDSWGNSLSGVAGQIGNILGAYNKMQKVAITSQTKQIKLDTDLSKIKEKYGAKSIEYIEAENKHIMDTSALKQEKQNAEIAGYANLAGAMASAFEQGSAGAIAFTTLQATLGIASSWTAIATAWALPFPSNIPAVAMVASAVLPIIAQLTSMGGSGGSGGGSSISIPSVADVNQENLDHSNKMITDRLDRQIELLEQLNLKGSAEKLKNISAGIQFDYEKSSAANNLRAKMEEKVEKWAGSSALNTFNSMISDFGYSDDIISYFEADAPRKLWLEYSNATVMGLANWMSPYIDINQREFEELQNEFQGSISEFISSVVDSVQTVQQEGEKLKDIYDELTNSSKYADERLTEAFKSVDSLRGQYSFAEYIENQIANIELLKDELSDENISLLLSQDVKDMRAQIELVNQISAKTGLVFENGAEDVLNYIDAIEMVSETLVTSKNNMMSFADSFKSEDMLLNQQAMKIGMPLAKDFDELIEQFKELSSDMFGLTDDELEYLNASKSMIEKKNEELLDSQREAIDKQIESYEEYIDTITKDISKLESIINSMTSTIDKLRGAVTDSEASLDKFYASMKESLTLSKTKDYDSFEKSLKNTISQSDALFEKSNFSSLWDMQFAQVVAANQFEGMQIDAQTEIDYLKQIEENTRNTVLSLQEQLEKMTNSTINSNDKLAGMLDDYIKNQEKTPSSVYDIYTKYDLHQYQVDSSGYEYWQNLLDNEGWSLAQLEAEIVRTANSILGKTASFAVGTTNVPYDMMAQIHKSEMIIPATFSDGLRTGDLVLGDTNEQIELLKEIKTLLQKMDTNIENIDDREDYKMRVGA